MENSKEESPGNKFIHLYKGNYQKIKIKFKVILIGDMGVGKSSIVSKFTKGIFPSSPMPTIAIEFTTKIIQLKEGGYIKAQIWDTAGQEKYRSITA